jgi:SAM-dependent methyltransferase
VKSVPCKICGNARAPLFGVADFNDNCAGVSLPLSGISVPYNRCVECGFLFTCAFDDWSEAEFKARIYNAEYAAVDPDYAEVRPRASAALVREMFGADQQRRILDWGGGNGALAAMLRAEGFDAETYDPFEPRFAQRPEGKFDLVTCFEVLEHVPDPLAGIADICACLEKDGMVLFSTLLQNANFEKLGMAWFYISPRNGHVAIFSRDALARAWSPFNVTSFEDGNLHIARLGNC